MNPQECPHSELHFGSGSFYIFCHQCRHTWKCDHQVTAAGQVPCLCGTRSNPPSLKRADVFPPPPAGTIAVVPGPVSWVLACTCHVKVVTHATYDGSPLQHAEFCPLYPTPNFSRG